MPFDSTVVVCAQNEETYVGACLFSILAQTRPPSIIIVVADRCDDRTEQISRTLLTGRRSLVIVKSVKQWRNSIAENLEMARGRAVGEAFVVVDADMVVPPDFLERIISQLGRYASVSAVAVTDPTAGFLNRLVFAWERTHRITPFGGEPRGGCRAVLMKSLCAVGGFRDVIAWDSDLDVRLERAGFLVKLDRQVRVLHRRKMTLKRSIAYQVDAGVARRELRVGFLRTVLHGVFRLRPFVVYGYIKSAVAHEARA